MKCPDPYRYIGAFQDLGTSGLYKLGAHYYNESTGRFTQPDPSGQETNRYNYSNTNPTTYSDPSGLQVVGCEDTGTCGQLGTHSYEEETDNGQTVWSIGGAAAGCGAFVEGYWASGLGE